MKIVLVGEYSRLHNSLKEGLQHLGCTVILISTGDAFKNYPSDLKLATTFRSKLGHLAARAVYKISGWDIEKSYVGWQAWKTIKQQQDVACYQFINQDPFETAPYWTKKIIKTIKKQGASLVLLACGDDTVVIDSNLSGGVRYSPLTPYLENPNLKKHYQFALKYQKNSFRKLHALLEKECKAIVASDFDYVIPYKNRIKFEGLIPNPINVDQIPFTPLQAQDKVVIFLGINQGNAVRKGISYFKEALQEIETRYANRVTIIKVQNLPYNSYIHYLSKATIVLDQVYSYDQGYNALEAMAMGKVVFTGAETEFLDHYQLTEDDVCIAAKPDVAYLTAKLSELIENPHKLEIISKNAREFIEKHHDYKRVALQYLEHYKRIN